jgi:hypothetical protein
MFENEVSLHWALSYHDNIAKLVGFSQNPKCIIIKLYERDLFSMLQGPEGK